jgi:hypothetical protein
VSKIPVATKLDRLFSRGTITACFESLTEIVEAKYKIFWLKFVIYNFKLSFCSFQEIIFSKRVVTNPPQLLNLKSMLHREDFVKVSSYTSNEWPGNRASNVSLIARSGRRDCGEPSAAYWRSFWV